MYLTNRAPAVPAIPAASLAASPGKPFVVKLHAQWCPVCMVTKDVWSEIERAYVGRVHLVVLDFTNQSRTDASRAEAARLGLNKIFDEYEGVTGAILVVDGRTRDVTADIGGRRDFAEYRTAIDALLSR
jgi:thiol-disulfide isomerase/thioredoxin